MNSPGFWIGTAIYESLDTRIDERASTHRAWLLGHIQRALDPPVADDLAGGSQRFDFCVGRGICARLTAIESPGDDRSIDNDDRSNRYVTGGISNTRGFDRRAHQLDVLDIVDVWGAVGILVDYLGYLGFSLGHDPSGTSL